MNPLSLFDSNHDFQPDGDRSATQILAPPPTDVVEDSVRCSPSHLTETSSVTHCYCGDRIQLSGLDAYKCPSCGWITWSAYRTKLRR